MKTHFFQLMFLLLLPFSNQGQRLVPPRPYHAEDNDDEDHVLSVRDDKDDEVVPRNFTDETGLFVGAACEFTCSPRLQHVYCNPVTKMCDCDKKYPVKLNNPYTGCSKPKYLGEQCYYHEACQYTDQHSACLQVHHNAICQCANGYHSVSIEKHSKRAFCAQGVISSIAVLSGLICFVLHLFNQNLYGSGNGRHRFGNANLAPPMLFSSDPGSLPLPLLDLRNNGDASQASSRRTFVSSSMTSRRPSSAAAAAYHHHHPQHLYRSGVSTVPASRAGAARTAAILLLSYCRQQQAALEANDGETFTSSLCELGSRRPSIASVHSSNSIKSYSGRRFEREREQKEEREMQRRLSKMTAAASVTLSHPSPSPSPLSVDNLLPTLREDVLGVMNNNHIQEETPPLAAKEDSTSSFQEANNLPSTSKQYQPS